MSELQDAIDRFTLALPLLDEPGEGAAQYRDDAQVLVKWARRVANLDIETGTKRYIEKWTEIAPRANTRECFEAGLWAALGVTTEDE